MPSAKSWLDGYKPRSPPPLGWATTQVMLNTIKASKSSATPLKKSLLQLFLIALWTGVYKLLSTVVWLKMLAHTNIVSLWNTAGHIKKQLTHPEVIQDGDNALESLADLHINVLIEAGSHRTERGQRRPIILASWMEENDHHSVNVMYINCLVSVVHSTSHLFYGHLSHIRYTYRPTSIPSIRGTRLP